MTSNPGAFNNLIRINAMFDAHSHKARHVTN